jgi:hypothetical protein
VAIMVTLVADNQQKPDGGIVGSISLYLNSPTRLSLSQKPDKDQPGYLSSPTRLKRTTTNSGLSLLWQRLRTRLADSV